MLTAAYIISFSGMVLLPILVWFYFTRRFSLSDRGSRSFVRMFAMCFSTAPTVRVSCSAIPVFDRPSALLGKEFHALYELASAGDLVSAAPPEADPPVRPAKVSAKARRAAWASSWRLTKAKLAAARIA